MASWFQEYLDSVDLTESPRSYFYWSMLTTISACVGRRVWLNRGGLYTLYPNIYTFLISKRSGLRKGIPVNISKKLAYDIGRIRVIDGQNSIQGAIKELSQVKTLKSGHVISDAEGFLITGEFASFMLTDGTNLSLTTLTDLYDTQYHDQGFTKRLASMDSMELKNPCLTALFASNETHFFDAVPKNAISGGFLARTFCIYEEKRNIVNSLTGRKVPVPKKINYAKILEYLHVLSLLNGEMIVEPKALDMYDDWYYPFCESDHQEEETGTSERIGDSILKAAILISLMNSPEMIILESHMEEAIGRTIETFNNVKRLLLGGSTDNKNIKSLTMRTVVATLISAAPIFECERKIILRKGAGMFGVYDLDETIEHLLQAGMIKIDKRGSNTYYKLTQMVIRKHMEVNKEEVKEEEIGQENEASVD